MFMCFCVSAWNDLNILKKLHYAVLCRVENFSAMYIITPQFQRHVYNYPTLSD